MCKGVRVLSYPGKKRRLLWMVELEMQLINGQRQRRRVKV